MYEAFFSLEDSPFVLTPDPRYLLRAKSHHEILGTLLYGITSQKGLMALIGDVGTGKTTLCRALLRELPKDIQSALVLNPHLSDVELLGTIIDDLGIERRGSTKGELMTVLSQHLLAAGEEGKTVVVILDEAQQMTVEALEQIRILSTLETPTRKLLQIVLVGQPELEERLGRRELRQLDQRIAIRCHLEPLSRKDTDRYIEHRLRVAGLPGALPFTRAALARIHAYSRGIPRVINLVCDRALMAAYSARAREVTPSLLRVAIRNLQGESSAKRSGVGRLHAGGWRVPAAATALVLLLGGAATAFWTGWPPAAFRGRPESGTAREGSAPVPAIASLPAAPAASPQAGPAAASAAPAPPAGPRVQRPAADNIPEGVLALVAALLRLWGVTEDLSGQAARGWPTLEGGAPDLGGVAGRYQLAATHLPSTTLEELRAIGLPALVEIDETGGRKPYLLRRMERDALTLVTTSGAQIRFSRESLDSAWTRTAWVFWRNVDQLPADPQREMNATVFATLALRLQKLGHLRPPLPGGPGERFQQAVRRFQQEAGLLEDGIVGPRTTLALSRVVSGRFSPSIAEAPGR